MTKILVVDDSALMRHGIRASIAQHTDWTVIEAENGRIALALAKDERPDLVVLDLAMPVLNGFQTAEKMSTIFPDMPIIMFTLHGDKYVLEAAHQVGIQQVFSKENGFGTDVINAMRAMLPD